MIATVPWYDVWVLHVAKHFITEILRKKIALVLELFPVLGVNHDNSLVQQTNAKTQMQQLIGIELSLQYDSHLWEGQHSVWGSGMLSWHDSSQYNKLVHAMDTRQGLTGV